MHRVAHEVSGSLIVALPGPDEDHNPATAASLADVLRGRDVARNLSQLSVAPQGRLGRTLYRSRVKTDLTAITNSRDVAVRPAARPPTTCRTRRRSCAASRHRARRTRHARQPRDDNAHVVCGGDSSPSSRARSTHARRRKIRADDVRWPTPTTILAMRVLRATDTARDKFARRDGTVTTRS